MEELDKEEEIVFKEKVTLIIDDFEKEKRNRRNIFCLENFFILEFLKKFLHVVQFLPCKDAFDYLFTKGSKEHARRDDEDLDKEEFKDIMIENGFYDLNKKKEKKKKNILLSEIEKIQTRKYLKKKKKSLVEMAKAGNSKQISKLLKKKKYDPDVICESIIIACENDDLDSVKVLSSVMDIDAGTCKVALFTAIESENFEIVQHLLVNPKIHIPFLHSNCYLFECTKLRASRKADKMFNVLFQRVDNSCVTYLGSMIMSCAENNHKEILRKLLKKYKTINDTSINDVTYIEAGRRGNYGIVKLLFKDGRIKLSDYGAKRILRVMNPQNKPGYDNCGMGMIFVEIMKRYGNKLDAEKIASDLSFVFYRNRYSNAFLKFLEFAIEKIDDNMKEKLIEFGFTLHYGKEEKNYVNDTIIYLMKKHSLLTRKKYFEMRSKGNRTENDHEMFVKYTVNV